MIIMVCVFKTTKKRLEHTTSALGKPFSVPHAPALGPSTVRVEQEPAPPHPEEVWRDTQEVPKACIAGWVRAGRG